MPLAQSEVFLTVVQVRTHRKAEMKAEYFQRITFSQSLSLLGYTHPLAVKSIPGWVAVVRWVIDTNHATHAFDPAGASARLLDFCFFPPARCTLAWAVQTVFGGIALVRRIIHAGHTPWAFNYAGPAAR